MGKIVKGGRWVEIDEMRFLVEPEGFDDFMEGMTHSLRIVNLEGEKKDNTTMGVATYAAAATMMIRRISDWEGVTLEDGHTKAPCTMRNKMQVFSDRDLLRKLLQKVSEVEEAEIKN